MANEILTQLFLGEKGRVLADMEHVTEEETDYPVYQEGVRQEEIQEEKQEEIEQEIVNEAIEEEYVEDEPSLGF